MGGREGGRGRELFCVWIFVHCQRINKKKWRSSLSFTNTTWGRELRRGLQLWLYSAKNVKKMIFNMGDMVVQWSKKVMVLILGLGHFCVECTHTMVSLSLVQGPPCLHPLPQPGRGSSRPLGPELRKRQVLKMDGFSILFFWSFPLHYFSHLLIHIRCCQLMCLWPIFPFPFFMDSRIWLNDLAQLSWVWRHHAHSGAQYWSWRSILTLHLSWCQWKPVSAEEKNVWLLYQ